MFLSLNAKRGEKLSKKKKKLVLADHILIIKKIDLGVNELYRIEKFNKSDFIL
jgi:hypothetical protein